MSNAHAGRDFEQSAHAALAKLNIRLRPNFAIPIGVHRIKKVHKFDLGSESPPILVECKSHTWTTTGNIPSAKLTVWNEAMYYFHCASSDYQRILLVRRSLHPRRREETLAAYYIRTHSHLIPHGVQIWELDEDGGVVTNAATGEPAT